MTEYDELDGLRVLRAGGGTVYERQGSTIREYIRAEDTGGRWGLGEVTAEPDEGVATHIHPAEPEAIVILEGPVELHGARGTAVLNAGDVIFIPPGIEHGLRTPSGGRWLAVWPASLDGLFEQLEGITSPVEAGRLRHAHGMVSGHRYRRGRPEGLKRDGEREAVNGE